MEERILANWLLQRSMNPVFHGAMEQHPCPEPDIRQRTAAAGPVLQTGLPDRIGLRPGGSVRGRSGGT
jgi:hypothetical protein